MDPSAPLVVRSFLALVLVLVSGPFLYDVYALSLVAQYSAVQVGLAFDLQVLSLQLVGCF